MEDLRLRQVGRIDVAIGLKGRAAAQQPDPFQKVLAARAFGDVFMSRVQFEDTEQGRDRGGPLDRRGQFE